MILLLERSMGYSTCINQDNHQTVTSIHILNDDTVILNYYDVFIFTFELKYLQIFEENTLLFQCDGGNNLHMIHILNVFVITI